MLAMLIVLILLNDLVDTLTFSPSVFNRDMDMVLILLNDFADTLTLSASEVML
jgi:hypothetical protein